MATGAGAARGGVGDIAAGTLGMATGTGAASGGATGQAVGSCPGCPVNPHDEITRRSEVSDLNRPNPFLSSWHLVLVPPTGAAARASPSDGRHVRGRPPKASASCPRASRRGRRRRHCGGPGARHTTSRSSRGPLDTDDPSECGRHLATFLGRTTEDCFQAQMLVTLGEVSVGYEKGRAGDQGR